MSKMFLNKFGTHYTLLHLNSYLIMIFKLLTAVHNCNILYIMYNSIEQLLYYNFYLIITLINDNAINSELLWVIYSHWVTVLFSTESAIK